MYINRKIEKTLKNSFKKNQIVILYGARQVGKSTMLQHLFPESETNISYLDCEQPRVQEQLKPDVLALKQLLGEKGTVVFDEMQLLDNPGLILKIIHDHLPNIHAVATGSASFDLASKISEPLTGRHDQFLLFPFSFAEISATTPPIDLKSVIGDCMIYGSYPKIFNAVKIEDKIKQLTLLTDDYLYKDILSFDLVKNSRKVRDLLVAIALQLGNEVSYHELSRHLGLNLKTVERYIDLLEKTFVIFRLYGFSRNLRNEISRKIKIYFYDCGVRNALINNFNSFTLRNDDGVLFENYIISELVKKNSISFPRANLYFWRTHTQQAIDLISEKGGVLNAYEIKLSRPLRTTAPSSFSKAYPNSTYEIITIKDFDKFTELFK